MFSFQHRCLVSTRLYILATIVFLLITGCTNGNENLTETIDSPQLSPSGSAGFSLIWPSKSIDQPEATSIDCNKLGIATITVDVYADTGSDEPIADASFECSAGQGRLENIPPGQNRRFVISGKDINDRIIYQGKQNGIEVRPNAHTDIGYITLTLMPPEYGSPLIIATQPEDNVLPIENAWGVGVYPTISATFSEAMNPDTINSDTFIMHFSDYDGERYTLNGRVTYDESSLTATFLPDGELPCHEKINVLLTSEIEDLAGNPFENEKMWEFSVDRCGGQVVGSRTQTFAIKADGTLWAWGFNRAYELGDGSVEERNSPTQIGQDSDWTQIAAGDSYSMAMKTDGTIWSWGSNVYGQLGDGTIETKRVPTQIGNDTEWTKIVAGSGSEHSMALKTDGTLWAWGDRYRTYIEGQREITQTNVPTQVLFYFYLE